MRDVGRLSNAARAHNEEGGAEYVPAGRVPIPAILRLPVLLMLCDIWRRSLAAAAHRRAAVSRVQTREHWSPSRVCKGDAPSQRLVCERVHVGVRRSLNTSRLC